MKIFELFFIFFILAIVAFLISFFIGQAPLAKEISFGATFSQPFAVKMGLNWQEAYLAILDDLKAKKLRLIAYWPEIEPVEGEYYFDDLDWQIKEAEKREVEVILTIGRKVPRWPECHVPQWATGLKELEQQKRILDLIERIILHYRDWPAIKFWQVENEPFFPFGDCPKTDKNFLKKEINLVKSLNNKNRPIIISDSGEGSPWLEAANLADILGITMYRKTHNRFFGVVNYPFPSVFYWRKAQIIKKIFNKEVICVELQAEPWGRVLLYDSSLEEQRETMDLEQFKKNMEFAKKTGLKEFYLWGSEWWYWMKEIHQQPEIWNEARKLF